MNKLKLNAAENILIYVDDGRWITPKLEDFKYYLTQYYIDKEEIFIDLIPYFCEYTEIIQIVSLEYKYFFINNINCFFIESIINGSKKNFDYLLHNYSIDFTLLPLKNLLIRSVYNYFNYNNQNYDFFYLIDWCFDICIQNNINIDCNDDDFLNLYLYNKNKTFDREISYIENMKNISNF